MGPEQKKTVVLFDGSCNFCTRWILMLIKADKHDRFRFSASTLPAAADYIEEYNLKDFVNESVIVIKDYQVYIKSEAVLMILNTLGGFWSILDFWAVLPRQWTDAVYDMLSKRRYMWFGKREQCMIPDQSIMHKFL